MTPVRNLQYSTMNYGTIILISSSLDN